jgi:hypothetical protein
MLVKTYEKTAERLLRGQLPGKPVGKLRGNRFVVYENTQALTPQGCRWRMFWRMKKPRIKPEWH